MIRILLLSLVLAASTAYSLTSPIPFAVIEKANKTRLKETTRDFQKELEKMPEHQGYIINFGTEKEVARREKIINNFIISSKFNGSRITIVRGSNTGKGRTVFYLIPKAEPPSLPKETQ